MKFERKLNLKLKNALKNLGTNVIIAFFLILALPILFIWLICEILYSPIGYVRLKACPYQKDFPHQYRIFDKRHTDSKVYTLIKGNSLPIEYFKHPKEYDLAGFFVHNNTILDFTEPFFYDE